MIALFVFEELFMDESSNSRSGEEPFNCFTATALFFGVKGN